MTHLDTHVLVWLFGRERGRIPETVQRRMDSEPLGFSPMAELELTYLFEVGRVSAPAHQVLDELVPALELQVSTVPFSRVVREAEPLTWTRDPFDRLIAAQALSEDAVLLTADETILANLPSARWS